MCMCAHVSVLVYVCECVCVCVYVCVYVCVFHYCQLLGQLAFLTSERATKSKHATKSKRATKCAITNHYRAAF